MNTAIIRIRDPRVNITYVYESKSYWDKERKISRAKRKLIGKIDPETGNIVPTSGRGRKKTQDHTGIESEVTLPSVTNDQYNDLLDEEKKLRELVISLQIQLSDMTEKMNQVRDFLNSACRVLNS